MRTPLALVLALSLGAPLAAQDFDYWLPIEEHVSDNGLRLLVLHCEGDGRVACKIFTELRTI